MHTCTRAHRLVAHPPPGTTGWRDDWVQGLSDMTLVPDGYLPFSDNVEPAAAYGVCAITSSPAAHRFAGEIVQAALDHGITHLQTGLSD